MSYVYRLAGDNLELARAELEGFLESQGINEKPDYYENIAFTESEPSQLKRLALVHEIAQIIDTSESLEIDYRPESFAVRSEVDEECIEERLGNYLSSDDNTVDLEDPHEIIKVYKKQEEYIIARLFEDINRGLFEQRKNQNRSFSSPVSLDPVLARVLVNISGVSAGKSLLDPFCGTGGILLEAGLCGIDIHGLDIQEEMVEGTKENLEQYGILSYNIREGSIEDVEEIFNQQFDAVVTDLPYGKASKVEGDPVKNFLETAPAITNGKIVFMSDKDSLEGLEPEFEIYVHKNLTRYIYLLSE